MFIPLPATLLGMGTARKKAIIRHRGQPRPPRLFCANRPSLALCSENLLLFGRFPLLDPSDPSDAVTVSAFSFTDRNTGLRAAPGLFLLVF